MAKLSEDKFDVATALLRGNGLWSNLGYWTEAQSYDEAAAALARLVGKAAGLEPGQDVLDLACGYGGSVRLWLDDFLVKSVDAIDIRRDCIESLKRAEIVGLRHAITGEVSDSLDLQFSPSYNAIVSVDAAYHFADAWILARLATRYLRSGGRLAYTTLVKADIDALKTSAGTRGFMKAASIPEAAVPTSAELTSRLADLGFNKISVEFMTKEVCLGFADFVGLVSDSLTLTQRLTPAWWKIVLTAKACRRLEAWGLSYALISCEK